MSFDFANGHDLMKPAAEGEVSPECLWPNWASARRSIKVFAEDKYVDLKHEAARYLLLVKYLRIIGFNAHVIRNGAGLPNGFLF
jgi:hypothetical protein